MKIAGFIILVVLALVGTLLCLSEVREEDDIYHDIAEDNHDK